MNILQRSFKILTICGCWEPHSWSTTHKKMLYKFYTFFVIVLVFSFTFTQFMDMFLNVENADDFTESVYMLLAMFISCCKLCSLLTNRRNIEMFVDILEGEPCMPVNDEEIEIQARFDKMSGKKTIHYMTLVETTIACIAVTSMLLNIEQRKLTFRAWLPYDYSSSLLFSVTYTHQLLSLTIGSLLHVACDGLICGLLIHTYCQMEVLECRLKQVENNRVCLLKKCVRHHDRIYRLAAMVNKEFQVMIFIQFLVSTLVVCVNLYQLVKIGASPKCLQIIMYMSCMLTQIFFYCWYGNEVKLKSQNIIHTVFGINWTALDIKMKKILLMIMRRATIPIEFSTACVISMNLDSFVKLLKTSYSAYTVLQQAQE